MNYQFDVIIVGDSKAGNTVTNAIASASKAIKVAFVSRCFKNTTARDHLNVEYIESEVEFVDYKNRLFCCYLNTGDRYFCTHLVIASGVRYAPLKVGNKHITNFNTLEEIPKGTKAQAAVVLGNGTAEAKLALAAAKKYCYVYLCTDSFTLNVTPAIQRKIEAAENLVLLPNASATKVTYTEENLLVDLSNYSTITCNAIFAKTPATPETHFVSDKLINKDHDGFFETSNKLESLKVPKFFAVGNCTKKYTKNQIYELVEYILKDFKGD